MSDEQMPTQIGTHPMIVQHSEQQIVPLAELQ